MQCVPSKRFVYVPSDNFKLDQNLLRSNGYFYTEKTMENYCQYSYKDGRIIRPDSALYDRKYLRVLILYNNGIAFHSASEISDGISSHPDYYSANYCEELEKWEHL